MPDVRTVPLGMAGRRLTAVHSLQTIVRPALVGLMYVHYVETGIDGCGTGGATDESTSKTRCTTRLATLDPATEGRLQHYTKRMENLLNPDCDDMDGAVSAPNVLLEWGPAIERNVMGHLRALYMLGKEGRMVW